MFVHGCSAVVTCTEHPRIFHARNSADVPGRFKKACDPDVPYPENPRTSGYGKSVDFRTRNIRGSCVNGTPEMFRAGSKKRVTRMFRIRIIRGLPDTEHPRTSGYGTPSEVFSFTCKEAILQYTWELGNNPY